jgi:hypothetical protein
LVTLNGVSKEGEATECDGGVEKATSYGVSDEEEQAIGHDSKVAKAIGHDSNVARAIGYAGE